MRQCGDPECMPKYVSQPIGQSMQHCCQQWFRLRLACKRDTRFSRLPRCLPLPHNAWIASDQVSGRSNPAALHHTWNIWLNARVIGIATWLGLESAFSYLIYGVQHMRAACLTGEMGFIRANRSLWSHRERFNTATHAQNSTIRRHTPKDLKVQR